MSTEGLFMPEVVREYLTAHAEEILADVAPYDGMHHELNPRHYAWFNKLHDENGILRDGYSLEGIAAFRDMIQQYEGYVRETRPRLIHDFRAYIALPDADLMVVGERPEQSGEELLACYLNPDVKASVTGGQVRVYPGYVFSIPDLGVSVATLDRTLTQGFFKDGLHRVSELLKRMGYVPVDRKLWEQWE